MSIKEKDFSKIVWVTINSNGGMNPVLWEKRSFTSLGNLITPRS